MAADVTSEVARMRERLRTSRVNSEKLKSRLQSPPELNSPAVSHGMPVDDATVSRATLNRILAEVLKKSPLHAVADDEPAVPIGLPVTKVKDPTPVV